MQHLNITDGLICNYLVKKTLQVKASLFALMYRKFPLAAKLQTLIHNTYTFTVEVEKKFLPESLCQFNTFISYLEEQANIFWKYHSWFTCF